MRQGSSPGRGEGEALTRRIAQWWERHPFTCGLAGTTLVGAVPDEALTPRFFREVERKIRKHHSDAQGAGEPLHARFIDYPSLRGRRVLDVGVGTGWSLAEFSRQGARAVGVDVTRRATWMSRRHLAAFGLPGAVVRADGERLPFRDGAFHFVHAWGSLHHMPGTELAVREAWRVLRPGGRLHAYLYNRNSLTLWWHIVLLRGVFLGRLVACRGNLQRLVNRYTDGCEVGGNPLARVFSPRQARALFRGAGFREVRVRVWSPPAALASFPAKRLPLGRILPEGWRRRLAARVGWGLLVDGRKGEEPEEYAGRRAPEGQA